MAINYDTIAEAARQQATEPKPPNPIPLIAGGTAAVAAGVYGATKIPAAVRAMPAIARAGARMIPGVGHVMDAADVVNEMRGSPQSRTASPPPDVTGPPPTPAPSSAPKIPANRTVLDAETIKAHPTLKNYKPGETIGNNLLDKIKTGDLKPAGSSQSRAPGKVVGEIKPKPRPEPTRPITVSGKPARAPAAVEPNGPGVGRGASGPALARRATARAAAVEAGAPMGSAESRIAPAAAEAGASDLERQLANSISVAQAAKGIAATTAERSALMNGLRGMAPPALNLLLMLMGSGDTEAQGNAARELAMPPAIRKALAGHQSQGI